MGDELRNLFIYENLKDAEYRDSIYFYLFSPDLGHLK